MLCCVARLFQISTYLFPFSWEVHAYIVDWWNPGQRLAHVGMFRKCDMGPPWSITERNEIYCHQRQFYAAEILTDRNFSEILISTMENMGFKHLPAFFALQPKHSNDEANSRPAPEDVWKLREFSKGWNITVLRFDTVSCLPVPKSTVSAEMTDIVETMVENQAGNTNQWQEMQLAHR